MCCCQLYLLQPEFKDIFGGRSQLSMKGKSHLSVGVEKRGMKIQPLKKHNFKRFSNFSGVAMPTPSSEGACSESCSLLN